MSTANKQEQLTVEEIVVNRLIEKFQRNNQVLWQCPFQTLEIPENFFTKQKYQGVNIFLLWGGSGKFITFHQLREYNKKNGTSFAIPKGTVSETIVRVASKTIEITQERYQQLIAEGKGKFVHEYEGKFYQTYSGLIYHNVFDCSQIFDKEGNPLYQSSFSAQNPNHAINESAEEIVKNYLESSGVQLKHIEGRAFYRELDDSVYIPKPERFRSSEAFYRVLFHELTHSTGTSNRLNRTEFSKYVNLQQRSREEFVAELGGMLLAAYCGFQPDSAEAENSEAYLEGWCNWFKQNPKEVFRGMVEAQRATDFIRGVESDSVTEGTKMKEEDLPKVKTAEEMVQHLAQLSFNNAQRSVRTWQRIVKAEVHRELQQLFKGKASMVHQAPVFIVELANKNKLFIGMSFAVYGTPANQYKVLYSLERGDSIEVAQKLALKSGHQGFIKLVEYMDLRKKITS